MLTIGAALLLGDEPSDEAELTAFWEWFEEMLVRRDPGLGLIDHGSASTRIPQRFGFLLSRLSDPDKRLMSAYGKLELYRRRSLFALRYGESNPDLESVVLLRVGLNAAANWFDQALQDVQAEAARNLFFWIYDSARRLWLTDLVDAAETKENLVVGCFAFMPFLFGDGLGNALKRAVPPLANDPKLLANASANLRINHIEPDKLRFLVAEAGADLAAALRDVQQWSDLTGLQRNYRQHLRDLAGELGLGDETAEQS